MEDKILIERVPSTAPSSIILGTQIMRHINSNFSFRIGAPRSSQLDFCSHPWSALSLRLVGEGALTRGQSSLLGHSVRSGREASPSQSGGTYPALRAEAHVLSSWIRLLSVLLMQIRCFSYRNDPVRVQS